MFVTVIEMLPNFRGRCSFHIFLPQRLCSVLDWFSDKILIEVLISKAYPTVIVVYSKPTVIVRLFIIYFNNKNYLVGLR